MPGTSNSGGRNKKATHLHVLQGTFRKDRHGDHQTPQAPPGVPDPPGPLAKIAKAEWDRMVARLQETGALSKVDDASLYQYVCLFEETETIKTDHVQLRVRVEKLMKLARTLKGSELLEAIGRITELHQILARHTQQLRQGHMAIRQYLVEFGMTPSARTRVKLPPAPPEKNAAKERFFGGA